MKKPFYKKWWFWLIVAVVLIALVVPESDEEEVAKETKKEKVEEVSENEEDNKDEPDVKVDNETEKPKEIQEEPKNKKIDINEEIKIGNVTIDLKSVKVEDDKLSVFAWWFHGAGREKIHFSVLATMSALQDGEYLEVTDGEDTFLRQTDYGVSSNLDVEYQLIDDKTPVEIRFRTTTDVPDEETITIELE